MAQNKKKKDAAPNEVAVALNQSGNAVELHIVSSKYPTTLRVYVPTINEFVSKCRKYRKRFGPNKWILFRMTVQQAVNQAGLRMERQEVSRIAGKAWGSCSEEIKDFFNRRSGQVKEMLQELDCFVIEYPVSGTRTPPPQPTSSPPATSETTEDALPDTEPIQTSPYSSPPFLPTVVELPVTFGIVPDFGIGANMEGVYYYNRMFT